MNEELKLATRKWNLLVRIIVWCFNKLEPKDKVDLICGMIMLTQESEECQKVVYISCGNCPDKIPRDRGMRALGFKEAKNAEGDL